MHVGGYIDKYLQFPTTGGLVKDWCMKISLELSYGCVRMWLIRSSRLSKVGLFV